MRSLVLSCGVWHWNFGGGSFGSCGLSGGTFIDQACSGTYMNAQWERAPKGTNNFNILVKIRSVTQISGCAA